MFIPRPFDTVTSLLVIIILMLGAEKKTIYSLYIHVFLCICHCNAIIVTFCLGGNPVVMKSESKYGVWIFHLGTQRCVDRMMMCIMAR